MNQPLYTTQQLEFTKLGAETALPEEPNAWSDAVLQELYKQVPYLADFDLNTVMEAVDGERGYGLGHVEVSSKTEAPMTSPESQLAAAGIRKARIPVIIKDSKLLPFDVIVSDDSKALPLTEARLRQVMFRPQNFDVTSKTPGDQSMIGQLYPPFRQNYGFGGGGVAMSAGMGGKTASILETWLAKEAEKSEQSVGSAKLEGLQKLVTPPLEGLKSIVTQPFKKRASTDSILADILSTANVSDVASFYESLEDPSVKIAYARNLAAHPSLKLLREAEPSSTDKLASAVQHFTRSSVEQVVRRGDGMYVHKVASNLAWEPREEVLDRGELVGRFGVKVALAADTAGSVTMSPAGGAVDESPVPGAGAGPISAPGMYQVQTTDGAALSGVVITNLLDIDGTALPISLFTDGQHAAVQSDISGAPIGEYAAPGSVPAAQAQGKGVFYFEAGGVPVATLPLELGATVSPVPGAEDTAHFDAQTFDGRPVQVSIQGYVATVVGVDGQMIIPESWCWVPLDAAEEVTLAETADEVGKVASAEYRAATVEIRAGGIDSFALRGLPVEKLACEDRSFLSQDQALFVLVGCGADPRQAQQKLAMAYSNQERASSLKVPHVLKLASEVRGESYVKAEEYLNAMPTFRHRLWKEAAVLPDPVAVDTVLSLGFLNPENVSAFIGYLPTLDEAQRRMCELLIGARLGLRELSDGALERAIRAVEDVIEGLKVIAFQS